MLNYHVIRFGYFENFSRWSWQGLKINDAISIIRIIYVRRSYYCHKVVLIRSTNRQIRNNVYTSIYFEYSKGKLVWRGILPVLLILPSSVCISKGYRVCRFLFKHRLFALLWFTFYCSFCWHVRLIALCRAHPEVDDGRLDVEYLFLQ